jgi:hypothetical protein
MRIYLTSINEVTEVIDYVTKKVNFSAFNQLCYLTIKKNTSPSANVCVKITGNLCGLFYFSVAFCPVTKTLKMNSVKID